MSGQARGNACLLAPWLLITATTLHLAIKRPTWEAIRDELLAFAANVYVYPLDVPEPSGDSSDYAPLMAAKAAALEQEYAAATTAS